MNNQLPDQQALTQVYDLLTEHGWFDENILIGLIELEKKLEKELLGSCFKNNISFAEIHREFEEKLLTNKEKQNE